jgi:hypothetical protein
VADALHVDHTKRLCPWCQAEFTDLSIHQCRPVAEQVAEALAWFNTSIANGLTHPEVTLRHGDTLATAYRALLAERDALELDLRMNTGEVWRATLDERDALRQRVIDTEVEVIAAKVERDELRQRVTALEATNQGNLGLLESLEAEGVRREAAEQRAEQAEAALELSRIGNLASIERAIHAEAENATLRARLALEHRALINSDDGRR